MSDVTIHSYGKEWEGAEIIGMGTDTFTGEDDVLIVQHPHFDGTTDFYAEEEDGKHFNVGNRAFWITAD